MLGIFIAIRNILIASILGWVGIQFSPPSGDVDRSVPERTHEPENGVSGTFSLGNRSVATKKAC